MASSPRDSLDPILCFILTSLLWSSHWKHRDLTLARCLNLGFCPPLKKKVLKLFFKQIFLQMKIKWSEVKFT